MQEELNSMIKNNAYELFKLPKGRKALKNMWMFKVKMDGRKIVKCKTC